MKKNQQRLGIACLCTLLSFSSWYYIRPVPAIALNKFENSLDISLYHAVVRQYDEKGLLAHHITSPEIHHIPKNDTYFLQSPHILFMKDKEASWKISAQKAIAVQGGERITFNKNVRIHQLKSNTHPESTLLTEKLYYFPRNSFAETTLPVTFLQPGTVVHSKGMKAYLSQKHVLLTRTHATYEVRRA